MDDPWDVKSVRQAGQYTSCMKLNGSPLLPPVLSKECRKEMQYYKLLAREVEKRISVLQPYVDSDSESSEDRTNATSILEQEGGVLIGDNAQTAYDLTINDVKTLTKQTEADLPTSDYYELSAKNGVTTTDSFPNLVLDFSLSINQAGRNVLEAGQRSPTTELPEKDYNCLKEKEVGTNVECSQQSQIKSIKKQEKHIHSYKSCNEGDLSDPCLDSMSCLSISSKSFTGSLNNIHTDSLKQSEPISHLIRQRSYTLLNPSPQLLAHLEVQSLNTGVEMSCISMSESLSNLNTPMKKRRSWDLETAKVKWSSMAMELKAKQIPSSNTAAFKTSVKQPTKKTTQEIYAPSKDKFVVSVKQKKASTPSKLTAKSEPIQKSRPSPIRDSPLTAPITKGPNTPISTSQTKQQPTHKSPLPKALISESEDPATKVRELYDKIQKQQLIQMANLVEKQKKEQVLLQQLFEDQNELLYKQLKTIVPKDAIEAKEAWGDKSMEPERGPVSLSQLMNHKTIDEDPFQNEHSVTVSPLNSTLTNTNIYISKCDNVLKKSRDISSTIKNNQAVTLNGNNTPNRLPSGSETNQESSVRSANRNVINSPTRRRDSLTRQSTNGLAIKNTQIPSPGQRNASRRLHYDSSSDREFEPILTDRTNDTMADLNFTFPTDVSDSEPHSHSSAVSSPRSGNEVTVLQSVSLTPASFASTNSAISCFEESTRNSMRNRYSITRNPPSPKQLTAAAKIVACAKGFLVRRLMRTERVTATVQTIRDALLCALQLHQDRQGIRGADVDLHRRLIQQITAACYSLHETFITSSPAERCAVLAADRARRRARPARQSLTRTPSRPTDIMSQSHSGVFPARPKRVPASLMTQSTYETYSSEKGRPRHAPSPRRRPWR